MGGLSRNRHLSQQINAIKAQQAENQNWYDQRYNEDATQRADAQRILAITAERMKRANRAARGMAAVSGGDVITSGGDGYGDAAAQIAIAGDNRKDEIENKYIARKNELQGQINELNAQKQNALDITNGAIAGAVAGMEKGMGVLDEILNRRGAAVGAAVDRFKQGVQQRADARQQQSLANNREQNSANPMLRGNRPQQPQQPQQSSGTVNQPGADQVPQVTDLAGLGEALERTRRAVDEARESEEDKQARERREKRQMLMAKLGDGLSAFHNAYSYMRGINPMTSGSMSAQTEARIKALGLERDKKYNDALDNYLKVLDIQRKEDYYNSLAETRRAQQESLDRDRTEKRKMQQEKNQAYINLQEAKRQNELEKSDYYTAYLAKCLVEF